MQTGVLGARDSACPLKVCQIARRKRSSGVVARRGAAVHASGSFQGCVCPRTLLRSSHTSLWDSLLLSDCLLAWTRVYHVMVLAESGQVVVIDSQHFMIRSYRGGSYSRDEDTMRLAASRARMLLSLWRRTRTGVRPTWCSIPGARLLSGSCFVQKPALFTLPSGYPGEALSAVQDRHSRGLKTRIPLLPRSA